MGVWLVSVDYYSLCLEPISELLDLVCQKRGCKDARASIKMCSSPCRNAAGSVTPSTSDGISSEQPGKSPGLAAVSGMDSTDSQVRCH